MFIKQNIFSCIHFIKSHILNNMKYLFVFIISVIILTSCNNDMSRSSRIKNKIALKKLNKIALINF